MNNERKNTESLNNNKKICFVIPYYNHPNNIELLVNKLSTHDMKIIIVDDGSTHSIYEFPKIIENPLVIAIRNEVNGGKGSAVITGLKKAKELEFDACLQIDADAQHDISKIDEFLESYYKSPDSLICAVPLYGSEVPSSRLYGRKITNFWVYINTLGGIKNDTMVGMRIYPIKNIDKILSKVKSLRMDFDIDIVVIYYKLGYNIIWIKVPVSYDENNVSHFKMFKDNLLISRIHARHFLSLPYLAVRKLFRLI